MSFVATLRRLCRPARPEQPATLPPGSAGCFGEAPAGRLRDECRGCRRWAARHEDRPLLTNLGALRLYGYCPDRLGI